MSNKIQGSSLTETVIVHLQEYFANHEYNLPDSGLYDRIIGEIERVLIIQTLNQVNNNQLKASKILGINRNTLRKKLVEFGVIQPSTKNSEKEKFKKRNSINKLTKTSLRR